ncbi:MAG: carbon-nitrogen hydrolase family protein [Planctomycetota bacterium]
MKIAGEHEILLSVGLLSRTRATCSTTPRCLSGPQGLLGRWRKLHIPMFEMPFYVGGDDAPVVDTRLGRIGINICFDALLPESTRLLAAQNVEIVLMPFAADPPPCTPEGWSRWASNAVRSRAMENGVFVIACNYTGIVECAGVTQRFPGGGMIVSPRGEILVEWQGPGGEPGMICLDLDANVLAAARAEPEYLYRFRRPELYGPLAHR